MCDLKFEAELAVRREAPAISAAVASGASRLLRNMGFSPLAEFSLGNGRRADLCAVDRKGTILIAEIKSGLADLRADDKWREYLRYCDRFYFAVAPPFPLGELGAPEYLPDRTGIIVADRFDGAIIREAPAVRVHASRRRAETLRFARTAANRLAARGPDY